MSEFTITLGRTGQVVNRKRGGDSVFDRIQSTTKSASVRHTRTPSSSHTNRSRGNAATKDARLGQKDLRLKLLRTRSSGIAKTREATANVHKRPHDQHGVSAPPSSGPEFTRNGDTRQVVSARDRGRNFVDRDPPRNYYSSLERDGSRVRSPPATVPVQHIVGNGALDARNHRPMQHPPPMVAPSVVACRPAPPLPPPNGTYQRSVYLGDASSSVPVLLNSLGLEKYVIQFQAEEIDMPVLKQMSDKDLKDMLIPMGPRKKILQAVMGICRRPPAPAPPLLPQRPL